MKKNIPFFGLLFFITLLTAFRFTTTKPTLYIIGDSTVKNGSGLGKDSLWGWGSVIAPHFDTNRIDIQNHAIGGRSSRTFVTDGRWDKIMATLKAGDFVIMQFGHNDAGALDDTSRARGTIRGISDSSKEIYNPIRKVKETVYTYGWYMRKYVRDAKSKGAIPIICSLVPRNNWDKNGKVVLSSDSYASWAQQIAEQEGVFFIDLNKKIASAYEKLSQEAVKEQFFPKDNTHTNFDGAKLNASIVVDGIRSLENCSLKNFLSTITLNWLGQTPPSVKTGVSWGVPFKRGEISTKETFLLKSNEGKTMPLQTWTNAYWDDGSLKWFGLATVVEGNEKAFELSIGKMPKQVNTLKIEENAQNIHIQTGKISCSIPRNGNILLDSLTYQNRLIGRNGYLVCHWQNKPDGELEMAQTIEKKVFKNKIKNVSIEQNGEIKAVVRIEGVFSDGKREWLPFIVRLYFYADIEHVRIVQTLIYDGEADKDFIKGIGWQFDVPMREEVLNRHVRFGGESEESGGIWSEPIQPLTGRRTLIWDKKNVYDSQFLGKRVPNQDTYDTKGQNLIKDWAIWRDFRLTQHAADGFSIQKRTHDKGAWIDVNAGKRASGLVFVGDVSGGLSLSLRDFWQSYPAAFEVKNAASDAAILRGWSWSPFGEAMDMRHYDTLAWGHGLEASYEDVQPGFSTPQGVARTSEWTLGFYGEVPTNDFLNHAVHISNNPPLLMATPQYLHNVQAFGVWSLPNRTTKGREWIENQLDSAFNFYKNEVEQRRWYGYWNYGDVMHTYDDVRHAWRYDIGGFAWANTELMPDLWLWYNFLRTGKSDAFRMAEAMTRHTSEVDVYHLGRFAGLGSRHNVRHWGCGSKEIRISQAALKRFLYYLTTDERTGELMREVANADQTLVKTDPLRLILPKSEYPTHARVGPDWFAMVGNWMTEWERTGDSTWKEKILRGVKSFAKMPYGFYSGVQGAFGYDPKTNELYQLNPKDIGQSHLSVLMGGPEVAFELSRYFKDADWTRLFLQYCELYGASKEETQKAFQQSVQLNEMSPHFCRLPAYFAYQTKNTQAAKKSWDIFLSPKYYKNGAIFGTKEVNPPNNLRFMREIPTVSTNNTAQWCLNAIELLELIGDDMPVESILWQQ
ncbi:MAG: rhamnogalacturonan acetylesterase [Saprospiraceae bacterium]|nr:rhamnogalacturonan acetylesterase [Saprospiraceae bacterium]